MRAHDVAGKRGRKVTQVEFARKLGWAEQTLRDVETGEVDISIEEYNRLHKILDGMIAEKQERMEVIAA